MRPGGCPKPNGCDAGGSCSVGEKPMAPVASSPVTTCASTPRWRRSTTTTSNRGHAGAGRGGRVVWAGARPASPDGWVTSAPTSRSRWCRSCNATRSSGSISVSSCSSRNCSNRSNRTFTSSPCWSSSTICSPTRRGPRRDRSSPGCWPTSKTASPTARGPRSVARWREPTDRGGRALATSIGSGRSTPTSATISPGTAP